MDKKYFGLSYPLILSNKLVLKFWKRFFCPRGYHLFDEVLSFGETTEHYFSCDACDLLVYIEKIDDQYVKNA